MISITNPPEHEDTRDKTLLCKMSHTQPNAGIHPLVFRLGQGERTRQRMEDRHLENSDIRNIT